MISNSELERYREIGVQLITRAQNDPTFMKALQDNPDQAITAAGLPQDAVSDVVRELDLAEVSGYAKGDCWFTCIVTCSTTTN